MQDIKATWVGTTAKQIARGVRRGDVSATQVVADHLEYISRADRELAAFRAVRGGEAITEAEKVDEQEDLANLPLAGVPVAVKENTPVAGLPTWNGSAAARSDVAEADHEVVRRLRGAGAVILGVTRMPELGLWALTDDDSAVTRNPWDSTRTPGGPPVARPPRWRPGWCRSRTATTASVRSGSPRPVAAWSGSSPVAAWFPASSARTTGSVSPSTAC